MTFSHESRNATEGVPYRELAPLGLLLVGHGTRSATGRAEMLQLAKLVAERLCPPASSEPDCAAVEPCFLELTQPTIDEGLARLAVRGVRIVVVAPLLLFAAGHAKQDIPKAVTAAISRHAGLQVRYVSHFGCDEELVELSAQRFASLGCAADETALVLVGRGSNDAEATADMRRFTELRAQRTPVDKAITCFLAMAEPRLETTLAEVAGQGWRQIVVQPHLLFHGDLLDRLRVEVAAARLRWPDREWLLAEHLGPAPELADLIVDKFHQALVPRQARFAP